MKEQSPDHFSILGGGFGIYGYAAAVSELNNFKKVTTLEKYRPLVRKHIASNYLDKFEFINTSGDLVSNSLLLNIALPPYCQAKHLYREMPCQHLFLEKPLAPSPVESLELCRILIDRNVSFSVGYLFLFTRWFHQLKSQLENNATSEVTIRWTFYAHHYRLNLNNWKRFHSAGGGALRFFAIHLVAVLSILKFNTILGQSVSIRVTSSDEMPNLFISFANSQRQTIHLIVDSKRDQTIFQITDQDAGVIFESQSPFDDPELEQKSDARIRYLQSYIQDVCSFSLNITPHDHIDIFKLWMEIENYIRIK